MFVDTVVLTRTIVIEGVGFHWSVTTDQRLAVSHGQLGTRVEALVGRPQAQARQMARAILAGGMTIAELDPADDLIRKAALRRGNQLVAGGLEISCRLFFGSEFLI